MENIGEESELMRYVKEFENSYYPPEIYSTIRDEYHEIKKLNPCGIMNISADNKDLDEDQALALFVHTYYFMITCSLQLALAIDFVKDRGSIYDYIYQRANGYSLGSDQLMTLGEIFDYIVDHDINHAKILLKIIGENNIVIFSDLVDSIENNDKALFISIVKENKLNVEIINKYICFEDDIDKAADRGKNLMTINSSYLSNLEEPDCDDSKTTYLDSIKQYISSVD